MKIRNGYHLSMKDSYVTYIKYYFDNAFALSSSNLLKSCDADPP